jgi:hypothetical protein
MPSSIAARRDSPELVNATVPLRGGVRAPSPDRSRTSSAARVVPVRLQVVTHPDAED